MFTVRWGPDLHTERETFPPPEFWHWTYKNFNRMLLIYIFNSGILCCCWTLLTAGLYCSKMKIVISFEMINIQGLIETFHENSIVGYTIIFLQYCVMTISVMTVTVWLCSIIVHLFVSTLSKRVLCRWSCIHLFVYCTTVGPKRYFSRVKIPQ